MRSWRAISSAASRLVLSAVSSISPPLVARADSPRLEFLFQEIGLTGVEEFVADGRLTRGAKVQEERSHTAVVAEPLVAVLV